jgi:hypothetical protein
MLVVDLLGRFHFVSLQTWQSSFSVPLLRSIYSGAKVLTAFDAARTHDSSRMRGNIQEYKKRIHLQEVQFGPGLCNSASEASFLK